jgi:hypothetical protein
VPAGAEPPAGHLEVELDSAGPGFLPAVPLPGEDGFAGNLRRGWVFMRESLSMASRDHRLLIPPLYAVFASTAFLICSLLVLHQLGWWDQFINGEHERVDPRMIGAGIWIIFGCYGLVYFFDGMTVHMVAAHLRGRGATLGEAFADALRNLGALLLLAAASLVVSLLTGRRRRRGLIDLEGMASEAIRTAWTAAVYLLLPIIILEDVSLARAFTRGKEIHARNLVPIVMAEVGVQVVGHIVGLVGLGLAAGAVYLSASASQALLAPALIGAGLWLALVMAYTGFLRTAYYTCLYLWATERETAAEAATMPRPLALAFGA